MRQVLAEKKKDRIYCQNDYFNAKKKRGLNIINKIKNTNMNILIFGASGATGIELINQSLKQGHQVTAFVRSPLKFIIKHDHLKVVQGDITDYSSVEKAIKNQEVVLCTLGAKSPIKRDPKLIVGMEHIIKAMEQNNIARLIYLSFIGVRENRKDLGFFFNYIIPIVMNSVIADHKIKENLIKKSTLNWTIIHPPKLTMGAHTGIYRSDGHLKKANSIMLTISRADLADFMLKQLTDTSYFKKTACIMH